MSSATVAGETLALYPERAAYWERRRTLLVADVHFGKAATFRAEGIPVPHGTTAEGLQRLNALIDRTGASRVVFLGDFFHAREGRAPGTLRLLNTWRDGCHELELILVRGNHDQHAGDPEPALNVTCVDGPVAEPPFVFAHRPAVSNEGYVLAGHLHPCVRLYGAGRQSARLPCFWFGARGGVLPAFGDFTGFADAEVAAGDQVWVIAEGKVLRASAR